MMVCILMTLHDVFLCSDRDCDQLDVSIVEIALLHLDVYPLLENLNFIVDIVIF